MSHDCYKPERVQPLHVFDDVLSKDSVMHLKEIAVFPVLHAQGHRWHRLVSVTVTDREDRVFIPPTQRAQPGLLH